MKKSVLAIALLISIPMLISVQAAESKPIVDTISQAEYNKKIVLDFYTGVFQKHQVKEYSDRYIGDKYIQHNPYVPNGKAPFVNYFTQYFKDHPNAKNNIKRAVADDDLVWLHVHATQNTQDTGTAVVDIFRVEHGKIVEHWDVQQHVPKSSENNNTMF